MFWMQLAGGMRSLSVRFRNFLEDEEGIGVVEVILILLVLVGLVILFREQITNLARSIFGTIGGRVDQVSAE